MPNRIQHRARIELGENNWEVRWNEAEDQELGRVLGHVIENLCEKMIIGWRRNGTFIGFSRDKGYCRKNAKSERVTWPEPSFSRATQATVWLRSRRVASTWRNFTSCQIERLEIVVLPLGPSVMRSGEN